MTAARRANAARISRRPRPGARRVVGPWGERVDRLLRARGQTCAELARDLGVSARSVTAWLAGEREPWADAVERLAILERETRARAERALREVGLCSQQSAPDASPAQRSSAGPGPQPT